VKSPLALISLNNPHQSAAGGVNDVIAAGNYLAANNWLALRLWFLATR